MSAQNLYYWPDRMSSKLLKFLLEEIAGKNINIFLKLPVKSPWVSFDYGGITVLSGHVIQGPFLIPFDEYEECWAINFRPHINQIDHLLGEGGFITIRVDDIISVA